MKYRYINKHMKGCRALKWVANGTWSSPWACPEHVFADLRGSSRYSTRSWIKWICNIHECPAELMVLDDDVIEMVLKEIEK